MRTFQLTQMVRGGLVLLGLGHLILNGADLCDGRRHVCRSLCRAFSLELGRFSQSRRYVRLIVRECHLVVISWQKDKVEGLEHLWEEKCQAVRR
jgi:hypothetical protein